LNKNTSGSKIYFASDFHLGAPDDKSSREREKKIVRWLDAIQEDAEALYLMGDVFDFWFEYKRSVPKGYTRLLGKLALMADQGVDIVYFTGNHDLWTFGYLQDEIGAEVHYKAIIRDLKGKKFYLAHGDGLGPGDHGYKFLKKIFTNRFCQWMFGKLHPNFGIWLANYFSSTSRNSQDEEATEFLGEDKEFLVQHAKAILQESDINYFIFGHRHYAIKISLNGHSFYINLGDWIQNDTYAVFDGDKLELKTYEE
jgi:UDP-2,3-diacylglucosamine hydrolase